MSSDETSYVDGWRQRAREEEDARKRGRDAALVRVAPAVAILVEKYGADRVVLFGSAARGDATADSDFDLAVEGVPADRLVQALLALEQVLGAERVDLVDLASAGELLRAKVEQTGIVLHD